MAFRAFQVLLLLLCALKQAASADNSPFEFIKSLVGSRTGVTVPNLHTLKAYLESFGYTISSDNDEFDDSLEAAIKTNQLNFNLNPTGTLNINTVAQMV
ncbi:hypothetical protein QQ045_017320 [Rhodiola kirilowii]